ncbi:MAG: SLBB domain-containing protein [bacterium]
MVVKVPLFSNNEVTSGMVRRPSKGRGVVRRSPVFPFLLLFFLALCTAPLVIRSPSAVIHQDYTIGPQDRLKIEVWDNSDLTREVSVSLMGTFTFPLIGEVRAEGLTTDQVRRELVRLLADGYLIDPQVTVTISDYRSKQVNILGEVKEPGTYPYTKKTSLIEMISLAGGLTEEAGPDAFILRSGQELPAGLPGVGAAGPSDSDPNFSMKRVDLHELLQAGENIYFLLQEDDTIYIPRADFYYVLGEVNRPGRYKLEKDTTVLKAITTAGGNTKKANLKRITVVREIDGKEGELPVDLFQPIQPDDIIRVPESFF